MNRLARAAAGALALLAMLSPIPATAQAPHAADQRVLVIDFAPDRVTTIRATLGYQLMIEFGSDERIENVSIGDALGWQVTPNRRANILFLKPIDGKPTNMTVVTDSRRYLFDLRLQPKRAAAAPVYAIRFLHPAPAEALPTPALEATPQVVNSAYAVTGAAEIAPARVFDDGQMTYFEWPPQAAMPAIFAVGADGAESLVNYALRDGQLVVQQLAPRFVLRNGELVTRVVNQGWPVQRADRRAR